METKCNTSSNYQHNRFQTYRCKNINPRGGKAAATSTPIVLQTLTCTNDLWRICHRNFKIRLGTSHTLKQLPIVLQDLSLLARDFPMSKGLSMLVSQQTHSNLPPGRFSFEAHAQKLNSFFSFFLHV